MFLLNTAATRENQYANARFIGTYLTYRIGVDG